jgi:SAM-dependent methyltransferase
MLGQRPWHARASQREVLARCSAFHRTRGGQASYSAFAEIYDFLIEGPALADVGNAFSRSVARFGVEFRSLADAGCGTGRFLAEMAHFPVALVGVDRSPQVLAIAARRLAGRPVQLFLQDMRRLSLPHPVDLVTCNNQTLNYLTREIDIARALKAIGRALRRGGMFLFDFIARLVTSAGAAPQTIHETVGLPDHTVNFEAMVDARRGASVVRIGIRRPGEREARSEVHRQRWFSPAVIARLLRACGFRLIGMRPMNCSQPDAWLHVVAQRM